MAAQQPGGGRDQILSRERDGNSFHSDLYAHMGDVRARATVQMSMSKLFRSNSVGEALVVALALGESAKTWRGGRGRFFFGPS